MKSTRYGAAGTGEKTMVPTAVGRAPAFAMIEGGRGFLMGGAPYRAGQRMRRGAVCGRECLDFLYKKISGRKFSRVTLGKDFLREICAKSLILGWRIRTI
jgi:hypothetical protein